MLRGRSTIDVPVDSLAALAGPTKAELHERAESDKARYHPANPKDYGSSVGMPVTNGSGKVIGYACVGCWHCEPWRPTQTERAIRALLRDAGLDY